MRPKNIQQCYEAGTITIGPDAPRIYKQLYSKRGCVLCIHKPTNQPMVIVPFKPDEPMGFYVEEYEV